MHRRKPRLSAHLRVALIPLIATAVLAGALTAYHGTEGPKRIESGRSKSTAPLVLPEMMDAARWDYIIKQSIRNQRVALIDNYLQQRNSPLAGTGRTWLECSERYGIPYSLAIGIMGWESAMGNQCFREKNAGGLMQYGGFATWEEYIEAQYRFLSEHFGHPQVAEDCPGYCEGTPQSWLDGVNGIRQEVERL